MKKIGFYLAIGYLSILVLAVIFYPLFAGSGLDQNIEHILESSQSRYWFGTDSLGRDLFARVLAGGRVSLLVGLIASLLSVAFGVTYGVLSGWYEGNTDKVLMRFCDILMAIPSFILVSVLCLTLSAVLPIQNEFIKALMSLCLGISATHWMSLARVSRGMVLELKRRPFVEAAIALGGKQSHILLKHIFPHIAGTVLIMMAMQVPTNILYESFMSFIGLGIHPPDTSWGILVREGWKTLSSFPHLLLYPSLILFLTVWSIQVLVDDLRKSK